MERKEDRDESQQKLRVVTKSIELMNYTQQITSNVKVFKPEYSWLTNVILAETINIHRLIYSANEDNLKEECLEFLGFDFKLTETGKVCAFVASGKAKHKRKQLYRMAQKVKCG